MRIWLKFVLIERRTTDNDIENESDLVVKYKASQSDLVVKYKASHPNACSNKILAI